MGCKEGSPGFLSLLMFSFYATAQKYPWPLSRLHFHSNAEALTPTDVNGSCIAMQHFQNVPLNV